MECCCFCHQQFGPGGPSARRQCPFCMDFYCSLACRDWCWSSALDTWKVTTPPSQFIRCPGIMLRSTIDMSKLCDDVWQVVFEFLTLPELFGIRGTSRYIDQVVRSRGLPLATDLCLAPSVGIFYTRFYKPPTWVPYQHAQSLAPCTSIVNLTVVCNAQQAIRHLETIVDTTRLQRIACVDADPEPMMCDLMKSTTWSNMRETPGWIWNASQAPWVPVCMPNLQKIALTSTTENWIWMFNFLPFMPLVTHVSMIIDQPRGGNWRCKACDADVPPQVSWIVHLTVSYTNMYDNDLEFAEFMTAVIPIAMPNLKMLSTTWTLRQVSKLSGLVSNMPRLRSIWICVEQDRSRYGARLVAEYFRMKADRIHTNSVEEVTIEWSMTRFPGEDGPRKQQPDVTAARHYNAVVSLARCFPRLHTLVLPVRCPRLLLYIRGSELRDKINIVMPYPGRFGIDHFVSV